MAARAILQLGNPLLWGRSAPVDDPASPETKMLIGNLSDTLAAFRAANGFGRGIAAPQIGVAKRVIFIRMEPPGFSGVLINPDVFRVGREIINLWDACFSLPNIMVKVSRAAEIEVKYTDEQGQNRSIKAEGDLAELLQHEIDHLDGILMINRAVSSHAFMMREEWLRQGRPE
jgi:peptide deformylase